MKLHSSPLAWSRVASLILILGVALTPRAADHQVTMTADWKFSPSSIEIQVGDTVTWVNRDDFDDHDASSTNPNAQWTTGPVPSDESVTRQFLTAGTYPYRDSIYGALGMTGTLVVKGGNPGTPTPATITSVLSLPDGAFRFTITNLTPGLATVVQVSTNLTEWEGVQTNFPSSDSFDFTNAAAALFPESFYRCYQVP